MPSSAAGTALPELSDIKTFSGNEFRPRGRSVFDAPARTAGIGDELAFDQPVWQRLNEYRNHDRIRVLTLWESGISNVTLQTDKRGGPSLQFTSRLMDRGHATHGILDRWFPTSIFSWKRARAIPRPGTRR